MRTAYRVMGMSTTKPENLPAGFTVTEKKIGDELVCTSPIAGMKTAFTETKEGNLVIYRPGRPGNNFHVRRDDIPALIYFLRYVYVEHS